MYSSAKIEPMHLDEENGGSALAQVVAAVASTLGASPPPVHYQYGPLCAAIRERGTRMTAKDSLRMLEGLRRIGVLTQALRRLLESVLQGRREDQAPRQGSQRKATLAAVSNVALAIDIVGYVSASS